MESLRFMSRSSLQKECPAVPYSHQARALDTEDHPMASMLPRVTEISYIDLASVSIFRAFGAGRNAPATLEDFIHYDAAQLSVVQQ